MARLDDIVINANLKQHRKTRHLALLLSDERAHSWPIDLWCWASQNEPSGVIRGKAAVDVIENVVGWRGDKGALVSAMITAGFLDAVEDGIAIHDWPEHGGAHIAKAKKDAKRAKAWRKKQKDRYSGVRVRNANVTRTNSNADVTQAFEGDKPNPKPKPKPKPNSKEEAVSPPAAAPPEPPAEAPPLLTEQDARATDAVADVLAHYVKAMAANHREARPTERRRKLVVARLREGWSPDDLKRAVEGLTWSDWHMGRDPKTNGQSFTDLKYALGSSERVEEFMAKVPPDARGAA